MWKGVPSRRELNCSGPEIYGLSVIGDRLAARIQPFLDQVQNVIVEEWGPDTRLPAPLRSASETPS
jgi:hypothetical protein